MYDSHCRFALIHLVFFMMPQTTSAAGGAALIE
jgi:hypothetical protein